MTSSASRAARCPSSDAAEAGVHQPVPVEYALVNVGAWRAWPRRGGPGQAGRGGLIKQRKGGLQDPGRWRAHQGRLGPGAPVLELGEGERSKRRRQGGGDRGGGEVTPQQRKAEEKRAAASAKKELR